MACAAAVNEGPTEELSDEEIYEQFRRITRGYVPKRYDGRIVLLASEGRLRENQDATLGWASVTSELKVRVVPGDHQTYITKHSLALAEELKACFAESQRESVTPITGLHGHYDRESCPPRDYQIGAS
jgi:thioesterase domain-containing protein